MVTTMMVTTMIGTTMMMVTTMVMVMTTIVVMTMMVIKMSKSYLFLGHDEYHHNTSSPYWNTGQITLDLLGCLYVLQRELLSLPVAK